MSAFDPNRTSWIGERRDPSLTVLVRIRGLHRNRQLLREADAVPSHQPAITQSSRRFLAALENGLPAFSPFLKNGLLRGWHSVPKPNQRHYGKLIIAPEQCVTSDAIGLTDTVSVADAAAATPRFCVKIMTRDEIAGCPAWAATFADRRKDHRYYEILEDTLRDRVEYGYFAIIDRAACIQAVQPFFLLDQDILEGLGAEWQTWLARIRRFVPRFLKMRTLMVGCFAGE